MNRKLIERRPILMGILGGRRIHGRLGSDGGLPTAKERLRERNRTMTTSERAEALRRVLDFLDDPDLEPCVACDTPTTNTAGEMCYPLCNRCLEAAIAESEECPPVR